MVDCPWRGLWSAGGACHVVLEPRRVTGLVLSE